MNKLKGAKTALEQDRYDDCVSDSYYACFQSVLSLMTIQGDASRKHQHTRQWVNKELGKKSKLPLDLTKHYNTLMDKRADADYSPEIEFDYEEATEILTKTEQFVEKLKLLIEEELNR